MERVTVDELAGAVPALWRIAQALEDAERELRELVKAVRDAELFAPAGQR